VVDERDGAGEVVTDVDPEGLNDTEAVIDAEDEGVRVAAGEVDGVRVPTGEKEAVRVGAEEAVDAAAGAPPVTIRGQQN
jgi:hypothetical protein